MAKPAPRLWYVLPAGTAAMFLAAPLLAHFHVIASLHGFLGFAASALPALAAIVLGGVLVFRGSSGKGLACVMIGAVPVAALASGMATGRKFPRINDISTNLDNPPAFLQAGSLPDNAGKDLSYPEEFKPLVREAYPDLIALQLEQPAEVTYARIKGILARHPEWVVTQADPVAMTFELSETVGLFQFTDDVVIRVLPLEENSQVDVRSRSRVGKGDFGANAARIRRILDAIQNS